MLCEIGGKWTLKTVILTLLVAGFVLTLLFTPEDSAQAFQPPPTPTPTVFPPDDSSKTQPVPPPQKSTQDKQQPPSLLGVLETLLVPADGTLVQTSFNLEMGVDYFIRVSGVYVWGVCDPINCPGGGPDYLRKGDAEYLTEDNWQTLLDPAFSEVIYLEVNGNNPDFGQYNADHVYSFQITGNGQPATFLIQDCAPCYVDNTGSLTVEILDPEATISGQVIGFDSQPLINVQVLLEGPYPLLRVATTDMNGAFAFNDLVDGTYQIRLSSSVFATDPEFAEVIIPPGASGVILKETAATPCDEVVAGIQLCQVDEQHTAIIDLENENIHIELANDLVWSSQGLFKLKPVQELVAGDSQAGDGDDKILHPYIAINGTGFSEEVSNYETYISTNSILSIDGKPFGYKCGPSPNGEGNPECFHKGATEDEDFYLKTSFMTYSANTITKTKIHRSGWDFADDDPRNYLKDRNYYFDETKATDYAIGYQSTLLDALSPPAGNQDGDKISGFEEYVANKEDHERRTARTAIGVSCDGKKLFISTIIPTPNYFYVADTTTAKWVRELQKNGACRVIMLDGGGSPQFSGQWEDGSVDAHAFYPNNILCGFFWCKRSVINAIVAYNASTNLDKTAIIALEGGTFSPSSKITISFAADTFDGTAEVSYIPIIRTDSEELIDVGVNFSLEASYQPTNVARSIEPNKPYEIVIQYDQHNVPSYVEESNLSLYFWNGTEWDKESSSTVDIVNNTVTAYPEHFGKWALLTNAIYYNYLPVIQK